MGDIVFVTLFSWLSGMEPTTDAQALPPVLALAYNDLLHRMKTPSGLHLKKYELVPRRRDALGRHGLWFQHATLDTIPFLDGVQLERATPLPLPELVIRQRHVEDVGHASRADNVVVVEQVAAFTVRVDRHVSFYPREWTATRNGAQEIAELG